MRGSVGVVVVIVRQGVEVNVYLFAIVTVDLVNAEQVVVAVGLCDEAGSGTARLEVENVVPLSFGEMAQLVARARFAVGFAAAAFAFVGQQ